MHPLGHCGPANSPILSSMWSTLSPNSATSALLYETAESMSLYRVLQRATSMLFSVMLTICWPVVGNCVMGTLGSPVSSMRLPHLCPAAQGLARAWISGGSGKGRFD